MPNDRISRDGELIMTDTCVEYLGHGSDLGRTWLCAARPHLTSQQRDQYQRWREVFERMREEVRPGRTALDLRRAALVVGGPKPWLSHHHIGHNIGLALAEPPFIGADLGLDYEESMKLKPGMVFVLEPCIWEDAVGVYRAEEVLVVTENGNEQISDFPHGPWAGAKATTQGTAWRRCGIVRSRPTWPRKPADGPAPSMGGPRGVRDTPRANGCASA